MFNHILRRLVRHNHQQGAKGFTVSDDHLGRRIDHQLHRNLACVWIGFFTGRIDDLCTVTLCVLKRRHHSIVGALIDHGCVVITVDRWHIGFQPVATQLNEFV